MSISYNILFLGLTNFTSVDNLGDYHMKILDTFTVLTYTRIPLVFAFGFFLAPHHS